jgi:DNA-binding NarL/FixJ family response regulator
MAVRDSADDPHGADAVFVLSPVPTRRTTVADSPGWLAACATYRSAVESYARAVRLKRSRILSGAARMEQGQAAGQLQPPPASAPAPAFADLTAREREVADLIAQGLTNHQIAEVLVITRGTAANHVAHILSKLGASNRTQVVARRLSSQR